MLSRLKNLISAVRTKRRFGRFILDNRARKNYKNNEKKKAYKKKLRDGGVCVKCRTKENLTIDHIIPKSKGGSQHGHHNLQVMCVKCNRYKGDKLPRK